MSYIGNTNTTQAFTPAIDYFNGTGSQTVFTLSRPVASVAQIQVTVNNVEQNPSSAYTVNGNTLTFTGAPSSGTNNVYVYYTSPITQVIQPGQGTVMPTSLATDGTFQFPNISYTGTLTGNGGIVNIGSGQIYKDASGNVGFGTTTPTSISGYTALKINNATNGAILDLCQGDLVRGRLVATSTAFVLETGGTQPIVFSTGGSEDARIDSSGNWLVGTTSAYTGNSNTGVFSVNGRIASSVGYFCHAGIGGGTTFGNTFNLNFGTGTQLWIDSTNQGTITVSSDYRIKKNIETQENPAIERILALRPVTYEFQNCEYLNWKADGIAREGFIAHELQAVIPSAVEGEKDAENQIQSLKLDALCSVMVKAIQELKAIVDTQASTITTLTERITALEGAK